MVRIKKKFIFFKVSEIWFANTFNIADKLWFTAWMNVKGNEQKWGCVKEKCYTVENDLSLPITTVFSNFSKTVQVETKQAEKLDVNCFFYSDTKAFAAFYNEFATQRNIDLVSEQRLIEMEGNLKLSCAVSHGQVVAVHSYLADKEQSTVRLMHAASARLNEKIDKQFAGKVNKLLHYNDMLHFKQNGFIIYDFGGYTENTTDKGLLGINNFKLSFGGIRVVSYNYYSIIYFIIKKLALKLGFIAGQK